MAGGDEGLLSLGAAVTIPAVPAPGSAVAGGGWALPYSPPVTPPTGTWITLAGQNFGTGGIPPGQHNWVITLRTAYGETTISPPASRTSGTSDNCLVTVASAAGIAGVIGIRLYRSKVSGAGPYYFHTDLGASGGSVLDTRSDAAMSATEPPATNQSGLPGGGSLAAGTQYQWVVQFVTALGQTEAGPVLALTVPATEATGFRYTAANLTGLPISGDARVTGRKLYRTHGDAPGVFFLEATFAENTTTTYQSQLADAALTVGMPAGGTAGAPGQVSLTGIAVGPGGTTSRRVYRTEVGGAIFKLLVQINDDTTTTYTDNKADSALGATAEGGTAFQILTGIPASGPGAILYDILVGDEVNILVQCDDAAAQGELAALEGAPSDGIVEHFIQDRRLALPMATATGNADLVLFARPIQKLTYATHDRKTAAGKTVSVNLPPLALAGAFTIQSVTIDQLDASPNLPPRYTVEASSVRWSLEDVLRRLQLEA